MLAATGDPEGAAIFQAMAEGSEKWPAHSHSLWLRMDIDLEPILDSLPCQELGYEGLDRGPRPARWWGFEDLIPGGDHHAGSSSAAVVSSSSRSG